MSHSSYEDLQNGIAELKTPEIEIWDFKYPGSNTELTISVPEFTCICPKTGLPDFAVINLEYAPDRLCIELKSFKLYLHAFRDVGIFHEHVTNRILDDFVRAAKPRRAKIRAEFNLRGGVKTTVERDYQSR